MLNEGHAIERHRHIQHKRNLEKVKSNMELP